MALSWPHFWDLPGAFLAHSRDLPGPFLTLAALWARCIGKQIIINKAEIKLPFEDYLYDDFPSPSALFISRRSVDGDYEFLPDLFEGNQGGVFDPLNKNYNFNITRHLNEVISEKILNDTLKIFPNGSGITANRVVLNGMNSTKKDKAKVIISYTKY